MNFLVAVCFSRTSNIFSLLILLKVPFIEREKKKERKREKDREGKRKKQKNVMNIYVKNNSEEHFNAIPTHCTNTFYA